MKLTVEVEMDGSEIIPSIVVVAVRAICVPVAERSSNQNTPRFPLQKETGRKRNCETIPEATGTKESAEELVTVALPPHPWLWSMKLSPVLVSFCE